MNKSSGWSIALSVLMIIVGLIAIVLPPIAGIAATIFFGWLLILAGVAHLIFSWHRRGVGGVVWEAFIGLIYLAAGFYLMANPAGGLLSLTLGLAIYLFAEAILEFLLSYQLRGHPGSGWLLVDGLVNLVLAFMIWRTWPFSSAWVIGTLVGIGILFTAFARLMLALQARHTAPPAAPVPPPPAAA